MTKIRSKRERSDETIPVFPCISSCGSHFYVYNGLVAAKIVVRVLIRHTSPPFAIEIVYCSIAS